MPYAAAISADEREATATVERMQREFQAVCALQAAALDDEGARTMKGHMPVISRPVPALLWRFYERAGWRTDCALGRQWLMTMVRTLGDSRVVEEFHRFLRLLMRRGSNQTRSRDEKMLWCIQSPVLPGRKCNRVEVTKNAFLSQWSDRQLAKEVPKKAWSPKKQDLSAAWSAILNPHKGWTSLSPESKRVEAAAWKALLRHATMAPAVAALLPVGNARMSVLFAKHSLVRASDSTVVFVTTQHDKYGVWAVRLEALSPSVFSVSPHVQMLHSWSIHGWEAASFPAVSPAAMQTEGAPAYGG